jgi:lysophospholipase L1-like esterase
LLSDVSGGNEPFMDALPPDPAGAGMHAKRPPNPAASGRTADYAAGAILTVLAFAVSPVAIRLLTGRADLAFRPLLLSLTFTLFLLLVAAAVLVRGSMRRLLFPLVACTLPLVLLAALEALAGATHLSDRVAMLQDLSTIQRGSDWGPGKNHLAPEQDGFALYRPWSGNGVTINELGLRTASPAAKSPGEYRIAVVGSSETWGFRLADADTIPALLQTALREKGQSGISVYNFGIEDATLARELALLRHFRTIYDIDQVIFIAGASDLYSEYFAIEGEPLDRSRVGSRFATFELYRAIERVRSTWVEPSPERLARFDARSSARAATKQGSLAEGIVSAADYCTATGLRCAFVLQPLVLFRRTLYGTEPRIAENYRRLYPRLDVLAAQLYRGALGLPTVSQIHDLRAAFDNIPGQLFVDEVHLNEAGNKALVDLLLPIATARTPAK